MVLANSRCSNNIRRHRPDRMHLPGHSLLSNPVILSTAQDNKLHYHLPRVDRPCMEGQEEHSLPRNSNRNRCNHPVNHRVLLKDNLLLASRICVGLHLVKEGLEGRDSSHERLPHQVGQALVLPAVLRSV